MSDNEPAPTRECEVLIRRKGADGVPYDEWVVKTAGEAFQLHGGAVIIHTRPRGGGAPREAAAVPDLAAGSAWRPTDQECRSYLIEPAAGNGGGGARSRLAREVLALRDALREIARCAPLTREWESTRAYVAKVLGVPPVSDGPPAP